MEILTRDGIDYSVAGHSLHEIVNYNEHLVLKALRQIYARTNHSAGVRFASRTRSPGLNALRRGTFSHERPDLPGSVHFVSEEHVRAELRCSLQGPESAKPLRSVQE